MRPSSICLGARRLGLTTKHGHNFYKGTRTGATGQHTKHGGYVVDWAKVRTYPRPTMMDACQLTPFVSKKIVPAKAKFGEGITGYTGQRYLDQWKLDNSGEVAP